MGRLNDKKISMGGRDLINEFHISHLAGFLLEISDEKKNPMMIHLRNISKVTWTAKRLASVIAGSPSRRAL